MDGRRRALLSVPFGYASLHCEQGTPIPLANDLQLFNFRWQSLFKFGWQWTSDEWSDELHLAGVLYAAYGAHLGKD